LGDGWSHEVNRQLQAWYRQARWPAGAPADFQRNLELSRIYMHLRWLGDRPEWTNTAVNRWKKLHAASKRLHLI